MFTVLLLEQAKAAASATTVTFGYFSSQLFTKKAVRMDSIQTICLLLEMIGEHILM